MTNVTTTNPFLLQDCCSELEAVGAGAPHVQERQEKEEQIDRDVPRSVFHIGTKKFGCAYGRDAQDNVQNKLVSQSCEGGREGGRKEGRNTRCEV